MPQLPDPSEILRDAESMRAFIVDLTLRICRERTVDYFVEDFRGGGPDGMKSPGDEGTAAAILEKELVARSIPYTMHPKAVRSVTLLARVGNPRPVYRELLILRYA